MESWDAGFPLADPNGSHEDLHEIFVMFVFFAKSQLGPTNGCHIFHGMFFLVQGPSVSCLPSYGQGLRNALQSAQKKLTSYEARDEKQALPGNWWISWQWKILQRYMQCLIWRTCSFGFGIPKRAG